MKKLFLLIAAFLSLVSVQAMAQSAPTPDPVSIYVASVPLSVTTSSARVVLPSTATSAIALTISNDGSNDACIALGTVSVVATNDCLSGSSTPTSLIVKSGRVLTIYKNSSQTYLAAVGSGSSALTIYQANGPIWLQGSVGAGGGGGAVQGTPADKGGTITVGGTSQTAVAANASRKNALCMNPVSATEDLYISLTGAATVNGAGNYADLAPGGSASILGTSDVSLNAATTSHRYLCTEWQ